MKASKHLESPEEHGKGSPVARGGRALREEGGFNDGEFGRGSTPYKRAHSREKVNGHSIAVHEATSGRGGAGIIGKGDGYKSHSEDVAHPASHYEFEALGAEDDGMAGGRD